MNDTRRFFLRALSLLGNLALAVFFSLFVYAHLRVLRATGDWTYALIALNEGLYVLFFVIRSPARAVSSAPLDWAIAFSGTFLSTLERPAPPAALLVGHALIVVGTVCNVASALSLNRSLGIVPAEREIRTTGLYGLVRHPMYASALVIQAGYLLANFSVMNVLFVAGVTSFLVMRAAREERFLAQSETYRQYRARVAWRLIPFVY